MKTASFEDIMNRFFKTHTLPFVGHIEVFSELPSTNTKAKDFALKGAKEGTVVLAEKQTRGRGRFHRRWESPQGGLYLSIVLRPQAPQQTLPLLSLVGALAVTHTINTFSLKATIRWPNDVYVNKKKIAGILLESEIQERQSLFVVLGVGINVNFLLTRLPMELRKHATTLKEELQKDVTILDVLTSFFTHFSSYYHLFQTGKYTDIIDMWKHHSDTLGRTVKILTSSEEVEGVAVDVDESGFLLVSTTCGEIRKITSGDCLYINLL